MDGFASYRYLVWLCDEYITFFSILSYFPLHWPLGSPPLLINWDFLLLNYQDVFVFSPGTPQSLLWLLILLFSFLLLLLPLLINLLPSPPPPPTTTSPSLPTRYPPYGCVDPSFLLYPFISHPLHTDISPARPAYLSLHHLTASDWLRLIYLLICVFIVLYSCLSCSD